MNGLVLYRVRVVEYSLRIELIIPEMTFEANLLTVSLLCRRPKKFILSPAYVYKSAFELLFFLSFKPKRLHCHEWAMHNSLNHQDILLIFYSASLIFSLIHN